MAQTRRVSAQRKRRRKKDRTARNLRLIILLLILFIVGMLVWFIWHDRDLRSGVSALKHEEYTEAIECFDASIADGKNLSEAYRGKGMALYELKKYKKADKALETAVEKGGETDAEICNLIGLCLRNSGKYKESIEWFEDGITDTSASDSLMKEMRYQLVYAYEKAGEWEEAVESAESYLADYPNDKKMARESEFLKTRQGE